jgi:hypothetical protein
MRRRACQNQGIPIAVKIIKKLLTVLSLNTTLLALKKQFLCIIYV